MNHAIVFAAKQFIGFELCKGLLNSGYHVVALDLDYIEHDNYEEKWMEIGRNANVCYQSIKDPIETNDCSFICFVPIYDYFALENEKNLNEWREYFKLFYKEKIACIQLFVFILPSHCLLNDMKDKYMKFNEIVTEVSKNTKETKVKEFYIPTIFGPWQPDSFLFQQLITGNEQLEYKDDCSDAIYVEDAIQTIIANLDESNENHKILLQSEEKKLWEKCVIHLNKTYNLPKQVPQIEIKSPKIIKVQEMTPYKDGLESQINCYKRAKEE